MGIPLLIPKPRQLKVSFAKITATKELRPHPRRLLPSLPPPLLSLRDGSRRTIARTPASLVHPRRAFTLGPALALGMTTVTVVDDPDLPRPPREREPRLAPPPAAPPPSDECADLPPTSAVDDRFLLATAAFLHIAARGAGLASGDAPSPTGLLRRYWTRARSPADGSRGCSTCTPTRGAGMANPTFPSFSLLDGTVRLGILGVSHRGGHVESELVHRLHHRRGRLGPEVVPRLLRACVWGGGVSGS